MLSVSSKHKQNGIAGMGILAAMMVVVFVAAIAIKQSWRSDIDLAQAGNRWQGMQAKAYIQGAETLATIALDKDKNAPNQAPVDTLDEAWAQPFEFPTDHGYMQIRISDAQAKMNLNALGQAYQTNANGLVRSGAEKYSDRQRQFIRLLQQFRIDDEGTLVSQPQAEEIMDALLDWLDGDDTVSGFGGAEENFYSQIEPPYTIANGLMVSVTEFARIKGVTRTLYNDALPYITALDDTNWINANTMDLALVRSINNNNDLLPLDPSQAETILSNIRQNGGMENAQDIEDALTLAGFSVATGNNVPKPDIDNFVFQSNWFVMDTTVTVGDTIKRFKSRIDRSGQQARVERRSDANF